MAMTPKNLIGASESRHWTLALVLGPIQSDLKKGKRPDDEYHLHGA